VAAALAIKVQPSVYGRKVATRAFRKTVNKCQLAKLSAC